MKTSKIVQFSNGAIPSGSKDERYHRRKDGLYQIEMRYTLPDGSRKRKSFYGKTQSEATAKKRAFERDLAAGIDLVSQNTKVKDYAAYWLKVHKANVSHNTLKTYRHDVDLLITGCGDLRLCDVKLSDVQSILNGRSHLSRSAIKKTAMTLRAVFEAARHDRIIIFNPCANLIPPKGTNGTHRAITTDERNLIINQSKIIVFILLLC